MKRAPKAYKDIAFLKSREARIIRILAEYIEPEKRFTENNIKHTVVFFGSSRINPLKPDRKDTLKYYQAAEKMAYELSGWGKELDKKEESFAICTGGGPGIMEATNRGAQRAKAKSIGLNISMPHEQEPNEYISPSLNFEFNYFFMRKLWLLYHAKAIVFFPGGYGTLDELFETLTLIQSRKIEKEKLLILLYDEKFWHELIDFNKLISLNLISKKDFEIINFFDTPEQGFSLLKPHLKKILKDFHI